MRFAPIALSLLTVSIALPALADTFDVPARKPGQWKMEIIPETAGAAPAITMEVCLDAETDKALMQAGLAMSSGCEVGPKTESGGTMSFDSTCKFGDMSSKSHTEISGDFQSSYSMKITSDMEGGPANTPKHAVMTQNATWIGECNGLKPGEMLMPGGMKVDALKAMKPGG